MAVFEGNVEIYLNFLPPPPSPRPPGGVGVAGAGRGGRRPEHERGAAAPPPRPLPPGARRLVGRLLDIRLKATWSKKMPQQYPGSLRIDDRQTSGSD